VGVYNRQRCWSVAIGADGSIFVSAGENLYAVNPDSTKKWGFAIGSASRSSPTVSAEGKIYVSAGENLCSVDPNGMLKWKFPINYATQSSPAVGADGTIYVGSGDGNLYAVNPDGTLRSPRSRSPPASVHTRSGLP